MLDHLFTDAIGALRDVLEQAWLEQQAVEERFQSDVLLGDLTWQTSYGIPGEGSPPRVQADITLEWPTWAQTAYRTWCLGESFTEPPRIQIEVVLRIQRLKTAPEPAEVLRVLPDVSSDIGGRPLEQTGVRIETIYDSELLDSEFAVEVGYEGTYELDEETLEDPNRLDEHFGAIGGWISSTLVPLGDLQLEFLPPDQEEETQ